MASLRRYDGTITQYSSSDLEELLAHLLSANSAGCSDGSVFFWVASPYLLLADLAFQVNRRLSELFEAQADITFPFGISFAADGRYYTLAEALLSCGYSGPTPQTADDLGQIYMSLYESPTGGADSKVLHIGTGSSLVEATGTVSLPARLKGLLGGQNILLSETDNDIVISASATPIASIGAGIPLIDPTSSAQTTYLATLAATQGVTISRNAGVLSLGLGDTLLTSNIRLSGSSPGLTLTPSGVSLVLSALNAEDGSLLGSFDQTKFTFVNDLQCRSFTSLANVRAVSFFVNQDSLPVPSGTIFKSLQDNVAALSNSTSTSSAALTTRVSSLESNATLTNASVSNLSTRVVSLESTRATTTSVTDVATRVTTLENTRATTTSVSDVTTRVTALENTRATTTSVTDVTTRVTSLENTRATTTSVTNVSTRVSALETSVPALTTRVSSLETTVGALPTSARVTAVESRVSALEATQTSQVAQLNTNTTDITTIKSQIANVSTGSATSVTLKYYPNDRSARIGGVPQFGLYRNGPTTFTMRYTADAAYAMVFNGSGNYNTGISQNSSYGWVLEWWAYIPRLFQQSMIAIVSPSRSMAFGLSGGGAFNCISSDGVNFALAQPEVNTWYLFGARMLYGTSQLTIYMLKQGTTSGNPLQQVSTSALQYASPLGSIGLYVGADPQNYSFQGRIVSPRFVDDTMYGSNALVLASLPFFVSFPLLADPSGTVCLLDSPDNSDPKNKVFPNAPVNKTGTVYTQYVNESVQNYVS